MTGKALTTSTLLWAAEHPEAHRQSVEATAKDFHAEARFCTPAQVVEKLRAGRFEIVGLELGPDIRTGLERLRELRAGSPHTTLIAASLDSDVATMRAALEAGASDFLSLPLDTRELHKALLRHAQATAAAGGARRPTGEIVSVYGVRGGLGTTTIAVNLASQLSGRAEVDVALVDLDLQRGDVSAFLNLTPSQSIASVAAMRGAADDLYVSSSLTRHSSGLCVLAAPQEVEEADVVGHADVELILRLLRSQFRWTVVDTPRTIAGPTLAALEHSDRILVLSDLSVPGVRAAQRTVQLLGRLGVLSRVELLITQVVTGPVPPKDAVRAIGRAPLLTIPNDEAASDAMNAGAPVNGTRSGPLILAMTELAARLAGSSETGGVRRGLFRRFFAKEART